MKESDRRLFMQTTAAAGLAAFLPGLSARADEVNNEAEEVVGATEDLMREHGVLNRVLLVYDEGLRRLRAKEEVTPDVFLKAATPVRKFVEDPFRVLRQAVAARRWLW